MYRPPSPQESNKAGVGLVSGASLASRLLVCSRRSDCGLRRKEMWTGKTAKGVLTPGTGHVLSLAEKREKKNARSASIVFFNKMHWRLLYFAPQYVVFYQLTLTFTGSLPLIRYVVVGKSHARSHIPFIEIGRHCSQTFFFLIDALFVSQSVCFFNIIFSHFQNCIFSMLYFIKIIQDT